MTAIAYYNGTFVPESSLTVRATDAGFVYGATVTERVRTFGGKLFRWEEHLDRLQRSLEIVGGLDWCQPHQLTAAAQEVIARNGAALDAGDDQGLVVFLTPGTPEDGPTVAVHSYPLPFASWVDAYQVGQRLTVSTHRQVPNNCWPVELKCRSRMHYFLADREARQRDPESRALILDQRGFVAEATTANIVAIFDGPLLVSPPKASILPGISLQEVERLAKLMNWPFQHRDLSVAELRRASEVLLCSTSPCLLPVVAVDGHPVGDGRPGNRFRQLIELWSDQVGTSIMEQAARFAAR